MGANRRSAYEQMMAKSMQKQTELAEKWQGMALPYYEQAMDIISKQLGLGFGELPSYVREAFKGAETQLGEQFTRAERKQISGIEETIKQRGLQGLINPNALLFQKNLIGENLAEAQARASADLKMQEALTGLNTSMQLLNMLKGGSLSAGQLGGQYTGISNELLSYLMQNARDPWGNVLGGAIAGASAGASVPGVGPWGAIIGALIGGYAGYRS